MESCLRHVIYGTVMDPLCFGTASTSDVTSQLFSWERGGAPDKKNPDLYYCVMYRSSGSNTGSNPGGGRILKKKKTLPNVRVGQPTILVQFLGTMSHVFALY